MYSFARMAQTKNALFADNFLFVVFASSLFVRISFERRRGGNRVLDAMFLCVFAQQATAFDFLDQLRDIACGGRAVGDVVVESDGHIDAKARHDFVIDDQSALGNAAQRDAECARSEQLKTPAGVSTRQLRSRGKLRARPTARLCMTHSRMARAHSLNEIAPPERRIGRCKTAHFAVRRGRNTLERSQARFHFSGDFGHATISHVVKRQHERRFFARVGRRLDRDFNLHLRRHNQLFAIARRDEMPLILQSRAHAARHIRIKRRRTAARLTALFLEVVETRNVARRDNAKSVAFGHFAQAAQDLGAVVRYFLHLKRRECDSWRLRSRRLRLRSWRWRSRRFR